MPSIREVHHLQEAYAELRVQLARQEEEARLLRAHRDALLRERNALGVRVWLLEYTLRNERMGRGGRDE